MKQHDTIPVFDNQTNTLSITDFSESNISRASLTGNHAHYESQVFSVQLAVNPLVSAAAPLLHITMQLRNQMQQPNLENLFKNLSHEVNTLEYRSHACDYPQQVIVGARYLICAFLDEVILNSSWGRDSSWQQKNLLNSFHHEAWGGERFFIILERCSQNPTNYIDLLELGYMCLSLGFKGKYSAMENFQQLEHIIDNLYKLIRRQRGDFPRYLSIGSSMPIPKQKHYWRLPSIWMTGLLTLLILTAIFLPYHYRLQQLAQPISQLLIDTPTDNSAPGNNE